MFLAILVYNFELKLEMEVVHFNIYLRGSLPE